MPDYSPLVTAISEVGHWRWWTERLPEIFQLEFGSVLIYAPPEDRTKPPSSILALRFLRPSHISFIQRESEGESLPADWPRQLQEDKIEPFGISSDQFALGDDAAYDEVVGQTTSETVHFTDPAGGKEVKLAFWAGIAGMRIEAAEVRVIVQQGEVDLATLASLHDAWWPYWRDYWRKRETPEAYPPDFACEVTFPAGDE